MADGEKAGYVVRSGKTKGAGKYARCSGCMCFACIEWVDERDDATEFPLHSKWPRRIARRDGGRRVRVKRGSRG